MEWLQALGICMDIVGATLIGWPVMSLTKRDALAAGKAYLAADTDEENLKLPPVVALLRQRTGARFGFGLLLLGFLLQLVGVLL